MAVRDKVNMEDYEHKFTVTSAATKQVQPGDPSEPQKQGNTLLWIAGLAFIILIGALVYMSSKRGVK